LGKFRLACKCVVPVVDGLDKPPDLGEGIPQIRQDAALPFVGDGFDPILDKCLPE